jgi:hypothetical protein
MIVNTALRMGIEKDNDIVHDSLGQFIEGLDALKEARKSGYDIVAHYVVAPSDVINNRLNEREKTDPRRIPRHIVDAAMSNNKHRMVDVADFADEFYLYDGESTGNKLLAKKEKGKNIEILDPKAFEYGNFEELVEDNAYFERPDTSKRSRTVAKNNFYADVIRDFDNGEKVSDIANKYKLRPRDVYNAVTLNSVDENRTDPPPTPRKTWSGLSPEQGSFDDLWTLGAYDEVGTWLPDDSYYSNSDYADMSGIYAPKLGPLGDKVADITDTGDEDALLNWLTFNRIDGALEDEEILRNAGWTDKDLAEAKLYSDSIRNILSRQPSGITGDNLDAYAESILDQLDDSMRYDLTSVVEIIAKEAKEGMFAPTAEFVALADEFDIPLWVVDHLYEQAFSQL